MLSALDLGIEVAAEQGEGPSAFVCSWTKEGRNAAWVRVGGTLDRVTVGELECRLDEVQEQARLVVLDLRGLRCIDRSGVRAVLTSSAQARGAGRRLVLVRGAEPVDRMFTLLDASGELEIHNLEAPASQQGSTD